MNACYYLYKWFFFLFKVQQILLESTIIRLVMYLTKRITITQVLPATQMSESGRIQSGKSRYSGGRMGGSKVERVGTDVGEWEDRR
jgi:hypothetical protein